MGSAEFRSALTSPWLDVEPVRLGAVPAHHPTADRFVVWESPRGAPLRVDLYAAPDDCLAFEEARPWRDFLAIGWGCRLFLIDAATHDVLTFMLVGYFGQLYDAGDRLLAASARRLFCVLPDAALAWTSGDLGIDGVIVERVEGGVVYGKGEWDPPGGWRDFAVSLESGAPRR